MKSQLLFSYEKSCGIDPKKLIAQNMHLFSQSIKHLIQKEFSDYHTYQTPYSCIGLAYDMQMQESIQKIVSLKKIFKPRLIVVVGIGGSSLGTKAVFNALCSHYDEGEVVPILFAETVDADYLKRILQSIEYELKQGNSVIINVVTKSGTTFETLFNFETILVLLKKYHPFDYQKYVVVTTGAHSNLFNRAKKEKFSVLEIPKQVGGRFSVFCAVGLFPLALAGCNIEQLCAGARAMTDYCLMHNEKNPAMISALMQWYHYQEGLYVSDLFLFSVALEDLGKWYRQLLAESLGKETDRNDKYIKLVLLPTVSIGSSDLHSVIQLYLSGAPTTFTTFITVKKENESDGMSLLAEATKRAYLKKQRPFCALEFAKKDEYMLGQFLQFKILEVIYLGELCNVNAFDQPQVELYKQEMHGRERVF